MPTKVLHIGQLIGGLDVYVNNIVRYADRDIEFVILYGDEDKPNFEVPGKIRLYRIAMHRRLNLWYDAKALLQAIRIIRREKPDVVHCHSAKGGIIGRIAGFITGVRTLYTPHAFSFLSTASRAKRWLYLSFERMARLNSYLLACSESEREIGISEVVYSPERAMVWSNSIPDVAGGFYEWSCEDDDSDYICYMARPSYQKNPRFLIEVIDELHKRLPRLKFYLFGVGYHAPDIEELKQGIASRKLHECVRIFPWLPHEESIKMISGAKLYLSVSRYEGLSLTILEAMSLGKAIIASDVMGNRDCVSNGVNGYLLPFDAREFADKIVELLGDRELRKRLENGSRKMFEHYFLINNTIKRLNSIYKEQTV